MLLLTLLSLFALGQSDQSRTGELRILVVDAAGLAAPGDVELVSEANQFRERLSTDRDGKLTAPRLPFGRYQVTVVRPGFSTFSGLVDVRSALPMDYRVTLTVAAIDTAVTVTADDTLIDLRR